MVQAHLGKRIRLIVPEKSNHPLTDFARHHYLRLLHDAGVEVLFYRPRMNHGKLMLMDDKIAMMGSANMDLRSLFVNFEIGVFLYSPEPIRALSGWVERLLPDCANYTEAGYAGASENRRVMEDFAHMLGPLL
jgi:cardiolipin synthase